MTVLAATAVAGQAAHSVANPRPNTGLVGSTLTWSFAAPTGYATWNNSCAGVATSYGGAPRQPQLTVQATLPTGWSIVDDPNVDALGPHRHLELFWTNASGVGSSDQFQGGMAGAIVQAPGGDRANLGFQAGVCGPVIPQESSPLGPAYPVAPFLADASKEWGMEFFCGFLAVAAANPANQPAMVSATLLVTDYAGRGSDTQSFKGCSHGTATYGINVPASTFVDAPSWLSSRASTLAGKSVHTHCSVTGDAWLHFIDAANTFASYPGGVAAVSSTDAYFRALTCKWLKTGPTPQNIDEFASGALAVAHLVQHMRGIADERAAECAAVKSLPRFVGLWGVRSGKTLAKIMIAARLHDRENAKHSPVTYAACP